MEISPKLIYKVNTTQIKILTYFFLPGAHYLSRSACSDQACTFKSLPRSKSSELKCIFQHFHTQSDFFFPSFLWWLYVLYVLYKACGFFLLLLPIFSFLQRCPTPQVPLHSLKAGSTGHSSLDFMFIFLLNAAGSSHVCLLFMLMLQILCSFICYAYYFLSSFGGEDGNINLTWPALPWLSHLHRAL